MQNRIFFHVPLPDTDVPRRWRWPRSVAASELGLTALLCAALVGLLVLGASVDEPVDPDIEQLAVAERAQLELMAQGCINLDAGARP